MLPGESPDPILRAPISTRSAPGTKLSVSRVEALLAVHEQEREFLKSSPEPEPTVDPSPLREGPGHEIGRYKLLQKIGEGGFGVVYMAEQHRPVHRKVALKIIKPGWTRTRLSRGSRPSVRPWR